MAQEENNKKPLNEFSKRFLEVIENMGITDYSIWKNTSGITKESLSKIRTGKGGASLNIIHDFCLNYPNTNVDYILTGRGTPLTNSSKAIAINTKEQLDEAKKKCLKLLPQVDFKFTAGQNELINGDEHIIRYWYLPDCKDCDCVAQIVGNSMYPDYPSGCWVTLKKYSFDKKYPNQIPFGNVFGIVVSDKITEECHGHIKVLRKYKDEELAKKFWIAHSKNDKEFDDFDIEIEQVRNLWIVKQHIIGDVLL